MPQLEIFQIRIFSTWTLCHANTIFSKCFCTTFADISGLSKAITPSNTSNQILVLVQVHVGRQNGSDRSYPKIRLVRGSTNIAISTESDSRQLVTSMWDVASADANSTGVLSMNWMLGQLFGLFSGRMIIFQW